MFKLYNLSHKFLFFIVVIHTLSSCASGAGKQLEGGAKDLVAPKPDSLRSTRNFQTNFTKQAINLVFNEWVVLENANAQVSVSPPLEKKPTVKLNGKTVVFQFDKDEKLRENATYSINFGESVKDLTEGNKAALRFVFSTGAVIDSLKFAGKVVDAFTQEPVENALFMLYDNFSDSVVRKERPFYFAKTNKQGFCEIENVRQGTFKAFALVDTDLNFKYSTPNEKIGFLKEKVVVTNKDLKDTLNNNAVTILLSETRKKMQLLDKTSGSYGQVKLIFSQNPKDISLTWQDKKQRILKEIDGDTLRVWYDNTVAESWKIFVLDKDTVTVKSLSREDFFKKNKLNLMGVVSTGGRGKAIASENTATVIANKKHELKFNLPIVKIDTSKIILREDSSLISLKINALSDSMSRRKVNISHKWQDNKKYNLLLLPGAITDFYGNTNDSIKQKISIAKVKDFGDINVVLTKLDSKNDYIVQVLDQSNVMIAEKIVKKSANSKLNFATLSPTKYKIRIITDENKNGRWDGCDYDNQLFPETVLIKELEDLKANWELETEVEIK